MFWPLYQVESSRVCSFNHTHLIRVATIVYESILYGITNAQKVSLLGVPFLSLIFLLTFNSCLPTHELAWWGDNPVTTQCTIVPKSSLLIKISVLSPHKPHKWTTLPFLQRFTFKKTVPVTAGLFLLLL